MDSDSRKSKAELLCELTELRKKYSKLEDELKTLNHRAAEGNKGAAEALLDSERRFRTLFESAPVGIALSTLDGELLACNKGISQMLGYSESELKKVNLVEVYADASERVRNIELFKKEGSYHDYEVTLKRKDGSFFTGSLTAVPFKYNNKNVLLTAAEDISQRKQAEEERRKLLEQLRQAQKMEAIGNLAGGIAHDFNNILGVIMGNTEISLRKLLEGDPLKINLDQVKRAAERAKEMVQQILMFSRKDQRTMKPVVISFVIQEALKFLRSSIPSNIRIHASVQEDVSPVSANETQINQIIMNLCTNAAYAMRENGGKLDIILQEIDLDPAATSMKSLEHGRYQQLTISDTGYGMGKDILDRIFEPYFTTKKSGDGTGMGLAVVHGIVKSHNGEITAYSEPGTGSTFNIFLPVIPDLDEPDQEIDPEMLIEGKGERILLVDDESMLVKVEEEILDTLGYDVTAYTDSVEALDCFRQKPDSFDLLITDMAMPDLTGVQLVEEIHGIRPGFPIILITGFSEHINEDNFSQMGIDRFVMKPLNVAEISRVIREVLDE